MNIDFVPRSGT